jgi:hypothetical protein
MTTRTHRQTKSADKAAPAKRGKPRQKSRGAPTTSDTADNRWTVRGVPLNVREMAVAGAKERNMTVGDWLAELIVLNRRGHTADDKANLPAVIDADFIDMVKTMNDRLTDIESRQEQGLIRSLFGRQSGERKAA